MPVKNMLIIPLMPTFSAKTYEKYPEMSNSANVYAVPLYDAATFGGASANPKVFSNSAVPSAIAIPMSNDPMETSMNCPMTVQNVETVNSCS